MTIPKIIFTNS